jgi:hypothetical protein
MKAEDPDQDLSEVLAEERSRGSRRKRIDTQERKKRQRLRFDILEAYRRSDEQAFRRALLEVGWDEASSVFSNALAKFRDAIRRHPPK